MSTPLLQRGMTPPRAASALVRRRDRRRQAPGPPACGGRDRRRRRAARPGGWRPPDGAMDGVRARFSSWDRRSLRSTCERSFPVTADGAIPVRARTMIRPRQGRGISWGISRTGFVNLLIFLNDFLPKGGRDAAPAQPARAPVQRPRARAGGSPRRAHAAPPCAARGRRCRRSDAARLLVQRRTRQAGRPSKRPRPRDEAGSRARTDLLFSWGNQSVRRAFREGGNRRRGPPPERRREASSVG
jgi:hypothetical protein